MKKLIRTDVLEFILATGCLLCVLVTILPPLVRMTVAVIDMALAMLGGL